MSMNQNYQFPNLHLARQVMVVCLNDRTNFTKKTYLAGGNLTLQRQINKRTGLGINLNGRTFYVAILLKGKPLGLLGKVSPFLHLRSIAGK